MTCTLCGWRVPRQVAHSDGRRCLLCILQAGRRILGVPEDQLVADEQRMWRLFARYQK